MLTPPSPTQAKNILATDDDVDDVKSDGDGKPSTLALAWQTSTMKMAMTRRSSMPLCLSVLSRISFLSLNSFSTDIAYIEVYAEPQWHAIELVYIIHVVILVVFPRVIVGTHAVAQECLVRIEVVERRSLPSHVHSHVEQEAHHHHHRGEDSLAPALGADTGQGGDDANHVVPTQASAIVGADKEEKHAAEYESHVEHEHVCAAVGYETVVSDDDIEEEHGLKEVLHAEARRGVVLRIFRHHVVHVAVGCEQSVGQGRYANEEESQHDTEDGLGGVFLYWYEIEGKEQQRRLVELVGYEPHYEELPQLPLEDVANAQPHYRGSQHLTKVGEREIEPKGKEEDHGVGIVVAIAPKRLVEAGEGQERDDQDEHIAVGGEPRQHNVQEDVALLAREKVGKGTTVVAAHGCGVGNGVEHFAVDVSVVAAKHVAHAHEDGEKRHVDHQEHLVLAVLRQLI